MPSESYIGRTVETLERRFAIHKFDSKRGNSKVNQFVRRVGSENLKMVLLQTTFCPLYAAYLEWYYWKRLGPGLNTLEPGLEVLLGKEEYQRYRNRKWGKANPGRKRELTKAWQKANPERLSQLGREHYERNKDTIRRKAREYYHLNKEWVCAKKRYDWALRLGRPPNPEDVPLPPPDGEGL